jgi:hypothetical protein
MDYMNSPTPEEVKAARIAAGLTQKEAGELVASHGWKTWQRYEYGNRKMHPATWELFLLKTKDMRRNK